MIRVERPGVERVSDGDYAPTARELVAHASERCLAMVFIVDPTPKDGAWEEVDGLLRELGGASWRGLDTRLLIGGSRTNESILYASLAGRGRSQGLGVDARLLAATEGRSEHSKMLIVDEAVLLGSHNWTPGALGGQTQDSVLVRDAALAAYLAARFESLWSRGLAEGYRV